jgi:RNA polymerase sigma factor (sigma-70 family)
MQELDDMALLQEYATRNSDAAFETLVSRRVHFVYSAAMRQARDPHLAEEITQAVFIILAQKAGKISDKTILTGWLFKTTRFATLAQTRAAFKRKQREQEAQMQSQIEPSAPDLLWEKMSPLLDEALAQLGEKDRQAVLLRFFENKNFAEVGNRLGTGEDTARKRVSRALEKLRKYFSKRGVVSTTAIIAGLVSANSVQAAPVALVTSISAAVITKGAIVSSSTLPLIKGALKLMAWTKAKAAIAVGVGVLLAAGTTGVIVKNAIVPPSSRIGRLLDRSTVVLEGVTYGKTHSSPISKPPTPFRILPAKWLRKLNWNSGTIRTSTQKNDTFVFWLKFNNSKGDTGIRYAIADENGIEAPVPFSGPHWDYDSAGFGTIHTASARSFGSIPHRSKKFFLRLYEQDRNGDLVRVANFPVQNISPKDFPQWQASSLPFSRETNGLLFTLEKAVVGLSPNEKLVPPYDSFPGQWSEFRFRVTRNGKSESGWKINEIWIYDATGNHIRTSKEDNWSLNGIFSRIENDEIICTHRWEFWPGESAWKLRVRFENKAQPDFWAEYFIKPDFLR